ncbi:MAG: dTMP kinase [Thermodesulfobacteriota bacterium]
MAGRFPVKLSRPLRGAAEGPHVRAWKFLVFEGIDGSGKSTQARMLAEALARHEKMPVILTAEPSDGVVGMRLRSVGASLSPVEQMRLFARDREDHLARTIVPALHRGHTVICDRYVYSNLAYQGALGIPLEAILDANLPCAIDPDLVFLMELDVDEALRRIRTTRRQGPSGFEGREFLTSVDAIYRSLESCRLVRMDGSNPAEVVHRRILRVLEEKRGSADPSYC